MSYVKLAIGAVGALAFLGAQANAATLQDLINNGTPIVSGNVIYSNFSSGGTLPASSITVNFTATGVQFTGNWNTLTPGNNGAVIGYTVAVDPSVGGTITSSSLFQAGQVVLGGGATHVGETLTDNATNTDYTMQTYYDGPGGLADNLRDTVSFNPEVTSLDIIKSIDVSGGANSFAALNFVENTFVSNPGGGVPPPVVPEPMSLALLPLALVGLGLRKKLAR